jgi:hypothetical protein
MASYEMVVINHILVLKQKKSIFERVENLTTNNLESNRDVSKKRKKNYKSLQKKKCLHKTSHHIKLRENERKYRKFNLKNHFLPLFSSHLKN